MTPTEQDKELREAILTEFKNVHRLAPADYTENCTNVVMSLIHQYVTKKQIVTRKEDWLWFADALMDRRIGADAALRELEKQLEGGSNE